MKRLKKLANNLPNSSKLSSKHISKIKGGAVNSIVSCVTAIAIDNDKRD